MSDPHVVVGTIRVQDARIVHDSKPIEVLASYTTACATYRGITTSEFFALERRVPDGAKAMEDFLNRLDMGDFKVEFLGAPGRYSITRVLE